MDAPTGQSLKEKQRLLRDGFGEDLSLRVHRAVSWLQGAERSRANGDPDAAFICYWIAFNAAYVERADLHQRYNAAHPEAPLTERALFDRYFRRIVALDRQRAVYDAIWRRFSNSIRLLIDNHYIFAPFWRAQHGEAGQENWRARFDWQGRNVKKALREQDTVRILATLFDWLYVLRNQLMHGGATWNGSVNRQQVGDGVQILALLVPHFVDLMMDNPDETWGPAPYPVVDA